jgi:hypothetical protein
VGDPTNQQVGLVKCIFSRSQKPLELSISDSSLDGSVVEKLEVKHGLGAAKGGMNTKDLQLSHDVDGVVYG